MELLFLAIGASLGIALLSNVMPVNTDNARMQTAICEEFRTTSKPDVAQQRARATLAVDPTFYIRARRARGMSDQIAPPPEVTPAQAQALMQQGIQLLDVRDTAELSGPLATLPGALHVPIHELEQGAAQLDPSIPILVFCKKGLRSGCAVERLQALGLSSISLQGSLEAFTLAHR